MPIIHNDRRIPVLLGRLTLGTMGACRKVSTTGTSGTTVKVATMRRGAIVMKILVVAEPGRVMLIGEGGRISGIVPGPQRTTGNPYLVFGPIIRAEFGVDPLETTVVVATVTSGDLEMMIV